MTASPTSEDSRDGLLVLADATAFTGELIGASISSASGERVATTGEVVFNTVLSGYQEVITDPSYAGQIITFTTPHIGNYGINSEDHESRRPFCRGIVIRELARRHSNYRAEESLEAFLIKAGLPGIAGVDTRRLTRCIRETGAISGAFGPAELGVEALAAAAAGEPGTAGVDLVATVTTADPYHLSAVAGPDGQLPTRRIVAYDFGIKTTILRHLRRLGEVEVVPANTPGVDVLERRPDGVFLSNGPGDPSAVAGASEAIAELIGRVPIFGICLGHQLLARAIGADTVKLPFGHHGGNHPVRDLTTDVIEITSQNHNFAVDPASLGSGVRMTHVNLNDGVCEGIEIVGAHAFGVQHHPEAAPGPNDSTHLFHRFAELMDAQIATGGA